MASTCRFFFDPEDAVLIIRKKDLINVVSGIISTVRNVIIPAAGLRFDSDEGRIPVKRPFHNWSHSGWKK